MELIIDSPKFGKQTVVFDEADIAIIESRNWHIVKRGKVFYAASNQHPGKIIYMHILIFGDKMIDHKDGDGLNNQRNNLRRTDKAKNAMNRGKTIKNTTGYKGVVFSRGKYQVGIETNVNGKRKYHYGGRFENILDAARKYNELALQYHDEFAKLNIIPC